MYVLSIDFLKRWTQLPGLKNEANAGGAKNKKPCILSFDQQGLTNLVAKRVAVAMWKGVLSSYFKKLVQK